MTRPERVFWHLLRRGQVDGLRFRRQHAIGRFVLDFYCAEHRLAVELDGGVHDDPAQAERDAARTEVLERQGIHVLRIPNADVLSANPAVIARIRSAVSDRPRPTHPGRRPARD